MAYVMYDGKKIIPAPLINIAKEYHYSGDGQKIGSTFNITLTGKLLPCKGSPSASGVFYTGSDYPSDETSTGDKFDFLTQKVEALRFLFATNGLAFEIQTNDGATPIKCYPIIKTISVPPDQWVDYVDYTIVLECSEIFGREFDEEDFATGNENFVDKDGAKLYLTEAAEDWSLDFGETSQDLDTPHTFKLQHNVSAVGKQVYDSDGKVSNGYEQAQTWVVERIGIAKAPPFLYETPGMSLPAQDAENTYNAYNHVRTENTNQYTGSYSITETWIIAKGSYLENFTVQTQTSADNGLTSVSIEGNVIGLESNVVDSVSTKKYDAALTGWNEKVSGSILGRAMTYGVSGLNPIVNRSQIGKDPFTGTVHYVYEYDTRATNCIEGALSESITVTDTNPSDVFATLPIIGRSNGPVLQNMNTITERRRDISIEVVMPPYSGLCVIVDMVANSPKGKVETLVQSFKTDLKASYTQVLTSQDTESWTPKNGRYTRNVAWVVQNC